jgi:hypothetical protein
MVEDNVPPTGDKASVPGHQQTLPRSAVLGIAEFFLWFATGLNMPWWAICLVLLAMWALATVVILRSEWTIQWHWAAKTIACVAAAGFVWALGSKSVYQALSTVNQPPARALSDASPTSQPTGQAMLPNPLTLRDLFDTDFRYANAPAERTVLRERDQREMIMRSRLFFNYNERSEFISLYFPLQGDPTFAYEACMAAAKDVGEIIASTHLRFRSSVRRPDETADTSSTELAFSGRVYVYLENEFSLGQMFALESQYRRLGLAPEFYGLSHLAQHANERRARPSEWRPGTFTLPCRYRKPNPG